MLLKRDIHIVNSKERSRNNNPNSVLFIICHGEEPQDDIEPFIIGHNVEGEHYVPLGMKQRMVQIQVTHRKEGNNVRYVVKYISIILNDKSTTHFDLVLLIACSQ